MTKKTLGTILSDGSLVDNTHYTVKEAFYQTARPDEKISIRQEKARKSKLQKIWTLLRNAADVRTEDSEIVFLTRDGDYEHNTDDPLIDVRRNNDQDFRLKTGNLVGTVGTDEYSLTVSSRFGDDFLRYIIADADGFLELPDHGGLKNGGYEWLLIYLWFVKLKKAFHLGLPKEYSTRTDELTRPRGRLDPLGYSLNRLRATYRCTYREHRYDGDATRLIARTLQQLQSHDMLRGTHVLNQTFQVAIQGQHSLIKDLLATPLMRNPYYAEYNPVIHLSKQILRHQFANFGNQSQTSAFLFDVSMLFEYFIRKLLKRAGIALHAKNNRDWHIPSGLPNGRERRKLIPDLIFDINGGTHVFDVKYKSFDFSGGVSREDLFQLHTYIGQVSNKYDVDSCGFIYPIRRSRWEQEGLEQTHGIFSEVITQAGRLIPFHVVFIEVPEAQNEFKEFRDQFKEHLERFLSVFLQRLPSKRSK